MARAAITNGIQGLLAFAADPSWKPPAMILMERDLAERAGQLKIYALFKI